MHCRHARLHALQWRGGRGRAGAQHTPSESRTEVAEQEHRLNQYSGLHTFEGDLLSGGEASCVVTMDVGRAGPVGGLAVAAALLVDCMSAASIIPGGRTGEMIAPWSAPCCGSRGFREVRRGLAPLDEPRRGLDIWHGMGRRGVNRLPAHSLRESTTDSARGGSTCAIGASLLASSRARPDARAEAEASASRSVHLCNHRLAG